MKGWRMTDAPDGPDLTDAANVADKPTRRLCARCLRPERACICRWITALDTPVRLLILQHPMEVSNAKGSARLLHLSVAGSTMLTGERFDQEFLGRELGRAGRTPVLLYPDSPDDAALGIAAPPILPPGLQAQDITLVVLDGTWRKSRKMLYVNPLLHSMPRLALRDVGA